MNNSTENYYSDRTRISNSNIGWFLNKGPTFLHKALTEDIPEEKSQALERGTMIHEYILQPEEFKKDYVIWDKSRPTSAQQEKFCQALALSTEIEPNRAILDAYKQAYSTAGKSEDKMLSEGQKIASTLKDYIDFLKANDGRIMISPWDYHMLKIIRYNIETHKLAADIVWPVRAMMHNENAEGTNKSLKAYHEFHINWGMTTGYGEILCKSLLDGLTLDFEDKKIIIYDLKTTQKLWHFEDSIDQYDYLRQLAYYTMAARWYLVNECGVSDKESFEWTVDYYIIGIDTTGSYEIRVFKIEPYMVESRFNTIINALSTIAWHQSNDKWEHSREYYEGDGSESLNL